MFLPEQLVLKLKVQSFFLPPIRAIHFLNYPQQSPAEVLQGLHEERWPFVTVVICCQCSVATDPWSHFSQHGHRLGLVQKLHGLWVWWGDSGWTAGAHQRFSALPSSAGWGRKYNNRLEGWDKGREWGTLSKTIMGKTDLSWGNYFIINPFRVG